MLPMTTTQGGTPIPPGTPTQVAHPWKATVRTFIATWIPLILLALTVIPQIVEAITVDPAVPDQIRGPLAVVATVAALIAGIITRIMAIPGLQRLLSALGLGTGVESEKPEV